MNCPFLRKKKRLTFASHLFYSILLNRTGESLSKRAEIIFKCSGRQIVIIHLRQLFSVKQQSTINFSIAVQSHLYDKGI